MGVISNKRVKKTTHSEFLIHPQHVEVAKQLMAEYLAESSTRTPLDELLTQTSTIASFCNQLRLAVPKKKQDFANLTKTITWLGECCEAVSELLKEYPAFKSSVVGSPHSVGSFRRDRNWHRTILNLGGDTLSRVTTPGGVCVDVRRSTKEGKIVFVADLLQKNWPAIRDQLRLLSDFDLQALREVLRDESEIVRRTLLTASGGSHSDNHSDTPKKGQNKSKLRLLNSHGISCIKEFKKSRKAGNPQSMLAIVKDYAANHPKVSESALYRSLTDHKDRWKPTDK